MPRPAPVTTTTRPSQMPLTIPPATRGAPPIRPGCARRCPSRRSGEPAAVDHQPLAGDVGPGVADQEADGVGHVLRLADPTEGEPLVEIVDLLHLHGRFDQ